MKRRQDPIRGRYTDRCSATLVWRSSRAWHPHFRRVPPANASLRQQIEPASGTGRQKAGLPEGSHHASRLRPGKDSDSAPSCPQPSPNAGSKQRDVRLPNPAAQDRTEAAHGAVQAHAVARMRARDEAGVPIPVAVALRVRAARLPECGHVRERHGFLAEHDDLFIDLKPRYLVLLKEDVARLLLLRGVENAVEFLLHGSRNFYHGSDTWQMSLTDLEAAQEKLSPRAAGRVLERGGLGFSVY